MSRLVIVESPAKCKKIQGFLGAGWKVIASMGHIRALEESLDAIGINRNFEPKYEFLKEKATTLKSLKDSAKDATAVYLASDDDREGEAISYAICLYLKLDPKETPRAVFHEITEKAVKAAVNNPRKIDMNRVNAQQARAMLDMMIGFTMSPLLWKYVAPASLSAGRCQTPALRLVVDREEQIKNFKATSSWRLTSEWSADNGLQFTAQLEDPLEDEDSALNYMENVGSTPTGSIISNDIHQWSEKAPAPLITSTLQQQASALHSINPKNCMKMAQRLYEAGHITYMRTDKTVLSEEAVKAAAEWITENIGGEYVLKTAGAPIESGEKIEETEETTKKRKKPQVAKGKEKEKDEVKAQEAHEAIRPTHLDVTEVVGDFTAQERKIYKLIWQRAMQSVMQPVRGETCNARIKIDGDTDFTWTAQWKRTTFEGWRKIGKIAVLDTDSEDDGEGVSTTESNGWEKGVALTKGSSVKWFEMTARPHETRATPRFTEATLVRELEKFGIGRPSTFASLLSTIQDKKYVEVKSMPAREVELTEITVKPFKHHPEVKTIKKKIGAEKDKLVPTELGRTVLQFMLQHFNDLFDYSFTAAMEKRLDSVAEGSEGWKQILKDMWGSYSERYNDLMKSAPKSSITPNSNRVKEFSGGIKAIISKTGQALLLRESHNKDDTQFFKFPEGMAFQDITEEIARAHIELEEERKRDEIIGTWNGEQIIKKTGKFGTYLKCGTANIDFKEGENLTEIITRFTAKAEGCNVIKKFKDFEIRNGQYGPYIMKLGLKRVQFVSVPKEMTVDSIASLSDKDVEALYRAGLEKKQQFKAYVAKKSKT